VGRRRQHDKHLPRRMYLRAGTYYFAGPKWINLGRDYGRALIQYAGIVGERQTVTTVRELLSHYLESSAKRLKPSTLEGYRNSSANLCRVFGDMALEDVEPAHVYRYLVERGDVQANRDRALLSAAYTHARRIGAFRGDDPAKGLQYRNPETPRKRYVTDDEFAALLAASPPKLAAVLRVTYLAGLRIGDALALRVSDLTAEGIAYQQEKAGARLVVEWTPELREAVEDAKRAFRRFGREWLFESRQTRTKAAGPYTVSGLRANFRRALAKAGLPHMTLHDLRRKAGSDVEDAHATKLLGHADAKVTRRHYRAKAERVRPVR
jgi:integrase